MKGNFIKVDENILSSPKIQKLIIARGYEGLGFFISLLTVMRNYQSTAFRIPLEDLETIASWHLHLNAEEQDRFALFIEKAIELDILKVNDEYLWSERRSNDLLAQETLRKKQSESAYQTNRKRGFTV